ncbi:hypothetical protein OH492_07780 [Vibrio chagasii]|nr:hypothetical protein [Vibrio chagasii]
MPSFTAKRKEVAIEMAEDAISESQRVANQATQSERRLSVVIDQAGEALKAYGTFSSIKNNSPQGLHAQVEVLYINCESQASAAPRR